MNSRHPFLLPMVLAVTAAATVMAAEDSAPSGFKRSQLDLFYWSEGAAFGDLDKDGIPDVISGPYWWKGPQFKQRHEFYPAQATFDTVDGSGNAITYPGYPGALGRGSAYSEDNFLPFVHDFSGDGWNDVLIIGRPGAPAHIYINPKGRPGPWARHAVLDGVDNESPTLADVTGDGRPEIICSHKGDVGYAEYDPRNPTKPWQFRAVSKGENWHRFSHGLGVGDIDGDGRQDIVLQNGWYQQPKSLAGQPLWPKHEFTFSAGGGATSVGGGAQMLVYDVDGDGLNDVITSLYAHGYGLAWYQQVRDASGITFKQHIIMTDTGWGRAGGAVGVNFSQLHALALADMDGDGLQDIVTGKTFWAHGRHGDPGSQDPAVVYWFRLVRSAGGVTWQPQLIDSSAGIGRRIDVADVNGDGRPDIISG
ncbi:FG-GAP-like repeat-containing protein, partial [Steroidobacter sp.]|uniref:FG-GAP-like repeat-containing protein n=1 Tax=Steroidobacter sp. TaxID=1978227 RepID=UPI001A3D4014